MEYLVTLHGETLCTLTANSLEQAEAIAFRMYGLEVDIKEK